MMDFTPIIEKLGLPENPRDGDADTLKTLAESLPQPESTLCLRLGRLAEEQRLFVRDTDGLECDEWEIWKNLPYYLRTLIDTIGYNAAKAQKPEMSAADIDSDYISDVVEEWQKRWEGREDCIEQAIQSGGKTVTAELLPEVIGRVKAVSEERYSDENAIIALAAIDSQNQRMCDYGTGDDVQGGQYSKID